MSKRKLVFIAQWMVENCLVVDTETTGLGESDTIVELALVDPKARAVLLDELVEPLSPMPPEAESVHGISALEALENGRSALSVINNMIYKLMPLVETAGGVDDNPDRKYIAAFNLSFDARLLRQTAYKAPARQSQTLRALEKSMPSTGGVPSYHGCIMELANRYFHEHLNWNAKNAQFSRLSLARCLEIAGIEREGVAHRALSDALAASDLLNFIAGRDL